MSKISYLPGTPIPAAVVLDAAKEADLEHCLVIGQHKDGRFYFGGTSDHCGEVHWLLMRANHFLMSKVAEVDGAA